jgi:hypothetical protein
MPLKSKRPPEKPNTRQSQEEQDYYDELIRKETCPTKKQMYALAVDTGTCFLATGELIDETEEALKNIKPVSMEF